MLSSTYYTNNQDFIYPDSKCVESKDITLTNMIISRKPEKKYVDINFNLGNEIIYAIGFKNREIVIISIRTSKNELLEKIFTNLNLQLKELIIQDELFKNWINECSQILECNIIYNQTEGQIKLRDTNLKENKFFISNIVKNKIIRMMFTLKGYENYLITVKYNGKISITPDPHNDIFYEILNILFNVKVIAK